MTDTGERPPPDPRTWFAQVAQEGATGSSLDRSLDMA
jgi:hypothetical protein